MYITSLDFGSSKIKGVICELKKDGSLSAIRSFQKPSLGIKRGEIIYPEETVKGIFEIINDIKSIDKKYLQNVICGISGTKSRLNVSKAFTTIPRPSFEILREDVEKVMKDAATISLPAGWQVIHSIPREFIIDDIEVDDANVIGLSGKKLEANIILISVFSLIYKNFLRVVNLVFGSKNSIIGNGFFSPLACAKAVLTKNQKELGVVLVDIGFGTTSVLVYQDGKLLLMKVLPVGTGSVVNDLALGLKCSLKTSEEIYLSFGCAFAKDVSSKEKIDLAQFEDGQKTVISKKYVAEIIESRVEEIFSMVNAELKSVGKVGKLPAGVVITGGGAKMPGIVDLARDELRLPVQIGATNLEGFETNNSDVAQEIEDPEMSVACGLVLSKVELLKKKIGSLGIPERETALFSDSFFKRIFKILIPSD